MNVESYKKLIVVLAMAFSLCGAANADQDGVIHSTSVVLLSKKIDSYDDLDIRSKPNKILSKNQTKSLWNAYKNAPKCFEHPTYGFGIGYSLKTIQKKPFMKNSWTSPFYKFDEENKH